MSPILDLSRHKCSTYVDNPEVKKEEIITFLSIYGKYINKNDKQKMSVNVDI